MRKEAVNTFNDGLNYDLNPITTPNTILTDCVNGTFITFNGDELALQNDSGNTKILISGETDKYVELSPGFYPLGIKEYGGVLYIVSGKSAVRNAVPAQLNTTYAKGEVIFVIDGLLKNYYLSKQSTTLLNLSDLQDTDKWESDLEQLKIIYDKVEFGSYPSPEILPETSKDNGIPLIFNDPTKNSLFTSYVLNDTLFKAGEYATFTSVGLVSDNITRYTYLNNLRTASDIRIYNVKLYLQLTNGFIDLTTDVWNEFAQFKGGNITNQFWFNDPDFKYYCKSNFKGKLVLSIELEDISFALNYYNVDQIDGTGYQVTFNISINNPTDWVITKLKINYSLAGILQIASEVNITAPTANYTLIIPFINEGNILEFDITPIFYNPGSTTDVTNELPIIYLNKYTLSGSELLSNVFNYDTSGTSIEDWQYYDNDYY